MLTKERLEELFEYRDGGLYWVKPTSRRAKPGARAGWVSKNGYRYIGFDGGQHLEHRLVWLLHHNVLPKYLDHVSGDPLDNRLENLRPATHAQNNWNMCAKDRPYPKGVGLHSQTGKYRAYVTLNNKQVSAGLHKTIEEADAAVRALREKLHGEFARHE